MHTRPCSQSFTGAYPLIAYKRAARLEAARYLLVTCNGVWRVTRRLNCIRVVVATCLKRQLHEVGLYKLAVGSAQHAARLGYLLRARHLMCVVVDTSDRGAAEAADLASGPPNPTTEVHHLQIDDTDDRLAAMRFIQLSM